ncbi:MAG: addiction module protein [Dethiobacter sp.]|jgi:putative addiction module component (TIGR02574 family)|nr:addiction module protein [Dethiobacter sp.]
MSYNLRELSLHERIRLVEDIWDSIAADQQAILPTAEQQAELDRRLSAYKFDGNRGRLAAEVLADIKHQL